MDTNVILPILTTVGGILIGWVLSEFSFLLRIYRADKRRLRIALYNLLDYYYLFNQLNIDNLIEIALKKIKEAYSISDSNMEEMQIYLKPFVLNYIKSINLSKHKNLEDKYQNSIDDIAAVNPILAYKLSGKAESYKILDDIDNYFIEAERVFNLNRSSNEDIVNFFKTEYKKGFFKEIQNSLKSDIYILSFKINIITLFKSWLTLKKLRGKIIDERLKKIDDILIKIENHINKKG